jgi:hypothetical protein
MAGPHSGTKRLPNSFGVAHNFHCAPDKPGHDDLASAAAGCLSALHGLEPEPAAPACVDRMERFSKRGIGYGGGPRIPQALHAVYAC